VITTTWSLKSPPACAALGAAAGFRAAGTGWLRLAAEKKLTFKQDVDGQRQAQRWSGPPAIPEKKRRLTSEPT